MSDLRVAARRTAVGMCAQVAAGREEEANTLLRLYVVEAMEMDRTPCEAFAVLAQVTVAAAVSAAGDEADVWFSDVAAGLAVQS